MALTLERILGTRINKLWSTARIYPLFMFSAQCADLNHKSYFISADNKTVWGGIVSSRNDVKARNVFFVCGHRPKTKELLELLLLSLLSLSL